MKALRSFIIDTLDPSRKIKVSGTLNNTLVTIDVMWTADGDPMVRNQPAELHGTSFHLTKSQWDELFSLRRKIKLVAPGAPKSMLQEECPDERADNPVGPRHLIPKEENP